MSIPSDITPGLNTRRYQKELLDESLVQNTIVALGTGSGKTHIAVLRMKIELERQPNKVSWFLAPKRLLCRQQRNRIQSAVPVNVGLITGENRPEVWNDPEIWHKTLSSHRIIVSTPDVLLQALDNGYVNLGRDVGLLVFDEAHNALGNHAYVKIMSEHYKRDLVRPAVLGLSASPYSGIREKVDLGELEKNLCSYIRTSRFNGEELSNLVQRPKVQSWNFRPLNEACALKSASLRSLIGIMKALNLDDDPSIQSLYRNLNSMETGSSEYGRLDQELSDKKKKFDTPTRSSLEYIRSTAFDLAYDFGSWAADLFIGKVVARANDASHSVNSSRVVLDENDRHLLGILNRLDVSQSNYSFETWEPNLSPKVMTLIESLLEELHDVDDEEEPFTGLIFVRARVSVLFLHTVLSQHSFIKDHLRIGCLMGSTQESRTRKSVSAVVDIIQGFMSLHDPFETLEKFRMGEKNLIITTSVAEEGIDVPTCGSVTRWDPPANMVSWIQSRGRARRKDSTFTQLLEEGSKSQYEKWAETEVQMNQYYTDLSRVKAVLDARSSDSDGEEGEDGEELLIESTGALLTTQSARARLEHFCSIIPSTSHTDNKPLYDLDPPDYPLAWHMDTEQTLAAYNGLYGAKVTLPRCLPIPTRTFVVERKYKMKSAAIRQAAFVAYKELYDKGLVNDHLLPLRSILEPQLEHDIHSAVAAVERRDGTTKVSAQINPWLSPESANHKGVWWVSHLTIEGLRPLLLFTKTRTPLWDEGTLQPQLFRDDGPVSMTLLPHNLHCTDESAICRAREFTHRMFWSMYYSRMDQTRDDYCYLFLPVYPVSDEAIWEERREWSKEASSAFTDADLSLVNAKVFGEKYNYPTDVTFVKDSFKGGRTYRFKQWQFNRVSPEEEEELVKKYSKRFKNSEYSLTYPLLVVKPLAPRTNLLRPATSKCAAPASKDVLLPANNSAIVLISDQEIEYCNVIPSVLRALTLSMTVEAMVQTRFSDTPLADIDRSLLSVAVTAPCTQDENNYQRLEILGDSVLKILAALQLLGEYQYWHQGYLTQKAQHCVANMRLAKSNFNLGYFKWIIRDQFIPKKWAPLTFPVDSPPASQEVASMDVDGKEEKPKKRRRKAKQEDLSTKVLADVMEALLGAAYLHGSFDLALILCSTFELGFVSKPISERIHSILKTYPDMDDVDVPSQISDAEKMLGYTFMKKSLLVEALTHSSWDYGKSTGSYERLEYFGDAVIDIVVTDQLFHAAGKNYAPASISMRKIGMVNAHFLAYLCLRTCLQVEGEMPTVNEQGEVVLEKDRKSVYLWQCILHSSHRILEDQRGTARRFEECGDEIEDALANEGEFPWGLLLSLQAPKFLSDVIESLVGAVYLDSNGNMDSVVHVLRSLGFMQVLERLARVDVDVRHPVSKLAVWAAKRGKKVDYKTNVEFGRLVCVVEVDGEVVVREAVALEGEGGMLEKKEVKLVAAEKAIKLFYEREKLAKENEKETKGVNVKEEEM